MLFVAILPVMNAFPRTLLLTRFPQASKYAGGEFVRKLIKSLPPDSVRWASLGRSGIRDDDYAEFGVPVHWRLRGSMLDWRLRMQWSPAWRAYQIARWIRKWRPEQLWVLPELDAVPVALQLVRHLQVPLHLTLHDAHEQAIYSGFPATLLLQYLQSVQQLARVAQSVDGVSEALVQHVLERAGRMDCPHIVIPPSVWHEHIAPAPARANMQGDERRIGFCGSMRVSSSQWLRFLGLLEALPYRFSLVTYADADHFPAVPLPSNVTIEAHAYETNEGNMITALHHDGLTAAYLGLWREPERGLFARTSLSSKLTAYAAAGVPVIVDAPADSLVTKLVLGHQAGIVLAGNENETEILSRLFSDQSLQVQCAEGALELALEVFVLEDNVVRFRDMISKAEM